MIQFDEKNKFTILKEDTAEFNAYSRTCRSDMRRQPVILTDHQLTKINDEIYYFINNN